VVPDGGFRAVEAGVEDVEQGRGLHVPVLHAVLPGGDAPLGAGMRRGCGGGPGRGGVSRASGQVQAQRLVPGRGGEPDPHRQRGEQRHDRDREHQVRPERLPPRLLAGEVLLLDARGIDAGVEQGTFSFSATNTMNGNHLNLTGFTVGENSINGSINYNGNTVNVTGVRHMN